MKVALFHFGPLENYPPVMNFISTVANRNEGHAELAVYTTASGHPEWKYKSGENVHIYRIAHFTIKLSAFRRYYNYFLYNCGALWRALWFRPDVIFYYETLSALVPCILKMTLYRRKPVFIHYHEYMSPADYKGGMLLNRLFHFFEKKIYSRASHISHTNEQRMMLFLQDEHLMKNNKHQILPNFPPAAWGRPNRAPQINSCLRIVYIGSLNFKDFYLEEFILWLERINKNIVFDIYALKDDFGLRTFISDSGITKTRFLDAVPYVSLPDILSTYHVGVILYKAHSENFKYNAPNKLFEYYACGLDVWLPSSMESAVSYVTQGTCPKISALDFSRLQEVDIDSLLDKSNTRPELNRFTCESIYSNLIEDMFKSCGRI